MKNNHKQAKSSKGFTLVELLIVITVIGVLASIVLVSISGAQSRARDSRIQTSMSQIRSFAQTESFPDGYYTDVCTNITASEIYADISKMGGTVDSCEDSSESFCLQATLNNNETWCVDPEKVSSGGCYGGYCVAGAAAPVVLENINYSPTATGTDTISFSLASKGEDRGMLVFIGMHKEFNDPSVTRVYFDAAGGEEDFSFVRRESEYRSISDEYWVMEVWKLENPSVGTASVVATINMSVNRVHIGGIAVSRVDTLVYDIDGSSAYAESYDSVIVNSPDGGLVVGGMVLRMTAINPPIASGFTEGWHLEATQRYKSSYQINVPAGDYNPFDNTTKTQRGYIAVSIAPLK